MLAVLLIGLLLAGVAAGLFARALLVPRLRAAETIGSIEAYGYSGRLRSRTRQRPNLLSRLDALAGAVGASLSARVHGFSEQQLRRQLMSAGLYLTPPRRFVGYQTLAALCMPAFWLWLSLSASAAPALVVAGTAIALLGGWSLPMLVVKRRAQRRAERIDYEIPELIDLLVTSVEAGVGFSGSLQMAARRFTGPLGDELRLTLQEQSMGLGINEALEHMLERCDTPATRSFIRSVIQGESLGVSIGQILRNLAIEMRKRRRQAAEERAQKAPVKMLFPLIFLIFPAMFVVLLGPAVYNISQAFSGR